jgi:LmbE family N-acetylglucosaminyl deacetylase
MMGLTGIHMSTSSRRTMLRQTALAAALPGSALMAAAPEKKLRVVITGGHPGDPEYGCGGTAARYSDLGHDVTLLYLNRGEGGIQGKTGAESAAVRSAEAARACEILKAHPVFAGHIDGQAVVDPRHYAEFHALLAAQRPDVVFAQWPIDGHADHRAISSLVYEAWLRMKKSFALYYYEVTTGDDTLHFAPTHYVDISAQADRKRRACFAHASQSPDHFYSLQEQIAKFRGVESGHAQAEAFVRHVQSPDFGLPRL